MYALHTIKVMRVTGVVFRPIRAIADVVEVPARRQYGLVAHGRHLGQFLVLPALPNLHHRIRAHLEGGGVIMFNNLEATAHL